MTFCTASSRRFGSDELGYRDASGFDASRVGGHGKNANELVALTKRAMPPLEASEVRDERRDDCERYLEPLKIDSG